MNLYHWDKNYMHVHTTYNVGNVSIPNTTTIAPPPAQAGKVSKWSPTVGTWVQVDRPVAVPAEVAMWKAKSILEAQGVLPAIKKAINTMPGDSGIVARQKWAHATVVSRTDSLVTVMQSSMGWSDEVVDGMFIAAANLE